MTSGFDQALFNATTDPTQPIDPKVISGVITGTSPSVLSSQAVSALFGFGSDIQSNQSAATVDNTKADQNQLEAQGYEIQGQGYQAEADAYTKAQNIANQNSNLALLSGTLTQAQNDRQALQAEGEQKAVVAGNGFGNAGSALNIYADTARQAAFSRQFVGLQANLNAGAYQQEAAASATEIASTQAAQRAAVVGQQEALSAADINRQAASKEAAAGVASETNLQNAIASLSKKDTATSSGANPLTETMQYKASQFAWGTGGGQVNIGNSFI